MVKKLRGEKERGQEIRGVGVKHYIVRERKGLREGRREINRYGKRRVRGG